MTSLRSAHWMFVGMLAALGACTDKAAENSSSESAHRGKATILSATAPSMHYALLTLSGPLGEAAADPRTYVIRDANGAVLATQAALVSNDGLSVLLTTAAQQPTPYELTLAHDLGIGAAGFVGSSQREPFLETALSLSHTTLQLVFSERLDKQLAEDPLSYRLFDPDTDLDRDIIITAAQLLDDQRTVVLTTTPQENRLYTVQVTNVKSRFACQDGDVSPLLGEQTGTMCAQALRPLTDKGVKARLQLTARTAVNKQAPTDANAAGTSGTVQVSNLGAGVGTATCGGNPCAASNGNAGHEEITIDLDVPTRADTVVLNLRDKAAAKIVLFLSSAASPNFDYRISTEEIDAITVGQPGDLYLAELRTLPQGLLIDRVRVRATQGMSCVTSICLSDGRTVDPTRNLANFYGTAAPDSAAPQLQAAESLSDTTVLLTFSEPLRPESANPAYFMITPALTVMDAVLMAQHNQIVLTTAPQQADVRYSVTASGIMDKAGNAIVAGGGDSASFVYSGAPEAAGALLTPRVVGAASTSNTTVVVTFSKAMSNDALNPANYAIVQQNVNPEVGMVSVLAAQFLGSDATAVLLTTRPQNEVTYTVSVTNVRDRFGNQLAAKQLQAGLILDPRSATFAGTPWSCVQQCANGHAGLGNGLCGSDNDCTDSGSCGATEPCAGMCQTTCDTPDPDVDDLADYDEQRGWTIRVVLQDGSTVERQVTSNPDIADTDGDGLSDATERSIGTDPRDMDTDDDRINDYDEYNVVYSDATRQDSDGDGLDDLLEVEFYKTNALVADSDGDGYDDNAEIFSIHRNPRVADLPHHSFVVGDVRLQLDQRFTYVDNSGKTQSETSSTASTLEQNQSSSTAGFDQTVGHWLIGAEFGLDSCQSDCPSTWAEMPVSLVSRLKAMMTVGGGQEFTTAHTSESVRATSNAYQESIEHGNELSASHEVSREIVGSSISVDVTFYNPSDVAITLSNLELRAATVDPANPTHLTPVGTLVAESTLQTGTALVLNLGPGQSRGPVVFTSRDVFPTLVEDLMRAPRGVVFSLANYDLLTGDQRNFAQGLQAVRERTVGIRIDKGDGKYQEQRVIASGALNRPRDDLRCAETGTHPGQLCSSDADCGDSAPCEGGRIVGGFSEFDGISGPTGLPLDFVLQDTLRLRKARPAQILAGAARAYTAVDPNSDDVQVATVGSNGAVGRVVVAPGRDGVLQTRAIGTDYGSESMRLLAGDNGKADTRATGDDVQVVPVGTFPLAPEAIVVAAGPNGVIDSAVADDDKRIGPDGIRAGVDGSVQSFARGDDVQLIPVGTRGVPEEAVAIGGGKNGILDTRPAGDDVADVVTGYEVSRTCAGNTPERILYGVNKQPDTQVENGVCKIAYAPHYVGETCRADTDCGSNVDTQSKGRCAGDIAAANGGEVVVRPGPGRFLDSVPGGDDVYVGPGIACTVDADCSADNIAGTCDGTQQVVRVEERRNGQYRRKWVMLTRDDTQFQTDFGRVTVRPGDEISLAFVQDIDRDGLLAPTEYLFGSSDYHNDTDGDGLSDFAEVRVGWEVGVTGSPLHHVFPDPSQKDSDGDGLLDKEEFDWRSARCACSAKGPKLFFGSGDLLRGGDPAGDEEARPCSTDADCGGSAGVCRDATLCTKNGSGTWTCPVCSSDATTHRTDPRQRDTDSDLLTDHAEVFGYLTGSGVVDPQQPLDRTRQYLVLAGPDRRADTLACPLNRCINSPTSCQTDGDCAGRACLHGAFCDNVQVLPVGTRVSDPRTVVAVMSATAGVSASDVIATYDPDPTKPKSISESRLGGDDVLIAGLNQSCVDRSIPTAEMCEDKGNFPFCAAIKPGADGWVSSMVGGNDALVLGGTGQRWELSDPLSSDSDGDLALDGVERSLGSSPNLAGDASFGGDLDRDGLTDSMERLAHAVTVIKSNGLIVTQERSEVLLSDTDFDGLPDYAERTMPCAWAPICQAEAGNPGVKRCSHSGALCASSSQCTCPSGACVCPTNPNKADTDGDGISDLDELSTEQLRLLELYESVFPGYKLQVDDSAHLGLDPSRADGDGDGLSDYFELYQGWLVQRYDGTVSRVYSNPRLADTDGDGMEDGTEAGVGVDPQDPDTDDDGRIDGAETSSNPKRPDLSVTITYTTMQITQRDESDDRGWSEWLWSLDVQGPGDFFPGVRVSSSADCPLPTKNNCQCETNLRTIPVNKSVSLTLGPGEGFVLNGVISEVYEDSRRSCPNGVTDPYKLTSYSDDGRYMSFVDQPVTYESLKSRQFSSRSFNLNSAEGNLALTVYASIAVNCEGSARGLCRAGSRCIGDADCESNFCSNGICVDLCGNGVVDNNEVCDDKNHLDCGTCSARCDIARPTPDPVDQCPSGAGCGGNADCLSNRCVMGRCFPVCGDGVREAGEACDDGNALACGRCNAACTGAGTGATCPPGTRCASDADCADTFLGVCDPKTNVCLAPPEEP